MYFIYSTLLTILLPFVYLRLLFKSLSLKSYRHRMAERFGFNVKKKDDVDIWLHAVSLGEVNAASALIDQLLIDGKKLLITTMTPTGSERVNSLYGNRVQHQYIPYDLPWFMKRFLRHWTPKKALIMETELWPNTIRQCSNQHIPLFLINARLSDHSFKGYKKFAFFFRTLIDKFHGILAQSEADSQRFKALASRTEIVHMAGNLKFDIDITKADKNLFLFQDNRRPVIILASTHDDEEQQMLTIWNDFKRQLPQATLLIAPRHPERFQTVYELAVKKGFSTRLRSQLRAEENFDVLVIDKIGELMDWYRLADFAVVGGSFIERGGHNVIEPVALEIPTFSGPHIHNFRAVCRALQEAGALKIVGSMDELKKELLELNKNDDNKQQMKINCRKVMQESRGAVKRYIDIITDSDG